jgi:hypothetical protein
MPKYSLFMTKLLVPITICVNCYSSDIERMEFMDGELLPFCSKQCKDSYKIKLDIKVSKFNEYQEKLWSDKSDQIAGKIIECLNNATGYQYDDWEDRFSEIIYKELLE